MIQFTRNLFQVWKLHLSVLLIFHIMCSLQLSVKDHSWQRVPKLKQLNSFGIILIIVDLIWLIDSYIIHQSKFCRVEGYVSCNGCGCILVENQNIVALQNLYNFQNTHIFIIEPHNFLITLVLQSNCFNTFSLTC